MQESVLVLSDWKDPPSEGEKDMLVQPSSEGTIRGLRPLEGSTC